MFAKLCSIALTALLGFILLLSTHEVTANDVNVTAEVMATGLGFVSAFRCKFLSLHYRVFEWAYHMHGLNGSRNFELVILAPKKKSVCEISTN